MSPVALFGGFGDITMTKIELAKLIATEITSRFYICTDRGTVGDGGYSANFYEDETAVEKLTEMIEPLLPNAADQGAAVKPQASNEGD